MAASSPSAANAADRLCAGPASASEFVPFDVDASLVDDLIGLQAGDLVKAILELVMNAIDAGATRVDISLPDGGATLLVRDDGAGFASRDEIMRHFAVFGFPHDDARSLARVRRHGRFGLGRGQIMAWGDVRWRSRGFEMVCASEGGRRGFRLLEHDHRRPAGCEVLVALRRSIGEYARRSLALELDHALAYAGVPVAGVSFSSLYRSPGANAVGLPVGDGWETGVDPAFVGACGSLPEKQRLSAVFRCFSG